jgi:hypothetical protein
MGVIEAEMGMGTENQIKTKNLEIKQQEKLYLYY